VGGSFTWGWFRFQVEKADSVFGLDNELYDDFDLRLTPSGLVPDLGGAPIASWVLARLADLTDDRLALASEEHVDGGGYVIEFVAYQVEKPTVKPQPLLPFDPPIIPSHEEMERPIAAFQLQGDMEGVAVLGDRAADCSADTILNALAAAILAAPRKLKCRCVAVYDPEWEMEHETYNPEPTERSRNWYGWDGSQFLGRDNVRDA